MANADLTEIRNLATMLRAEMRELKAEYLSKQKALKWRLKDVQRRCPHSSIPKDTLSGTLRWQETCNYGKVCKDCGYVVPTPKDFHFQ